MRVSVITVAYNSGATIRHTLDSVLAQTYNDLEHIIIDGASTDSTEQIVRDYEEHYFRSGKSLRWLSETDAGMYDAMNKGIRMASGDIVGMLNSDDRYIDREVVADIVSAFADQEVDCIYGNVVYVSPADRRVIRDFKSSAFTLGLFEKSWTPAHMTFYCRGHLYHGLGFYRTDFKIAADVELMHRFLQQAGKRSLYLDRYMVEMNAGGVSNRGIMSTYIITKEMMKVLRGYNPKFCLLKYLLYKFMKISQFVSAGARRVAR